MKNAFVRFIKEEEGLEMLEWAVVAALFVGVGSTAWSTLQGQIGTSLAGYSGDLANTP